MCCYVVRVGDIVAKKALGAPEARQRWCQCCNEFGEMVSEEVKTNPRYNNVKMSWKSPT